MIVAFLLAFTSLAASSVRATEPVIDKDEAEVLFCDSSDAWQTLFDGGSLSEWELVEGGPASWIDKLAFWRRLGSSGGWTVDQQGNLFRGASAGDLRSKNQYADFYLKLEWKISTAGNSGIKLRVADEGGKPANTGFEMQILDDQNHKDGKNPLTSAGAMYGLYPSKHPEAARAVGEWNQVGIIVRANEVQFWLNGFNTVSALIGTRDWQQRLEKSPQRDRVSDLFAQYPKGHIVLQDHFDDVWFRNISICEIPSSTATE